MGRVGLVRTSVGDGLSRGCVRGGAAGERCRWRLACRNRAVRVKIAE